MYTILSFSMLRDRLTLTCYVVQISLEFDNDPPASVTQVLRLLVWATTFQLVYKEASVFFDVTGE